MADFLSENILQTIRRSVIAGSKADLAVAYWGQGATKLLGLDQSAAELRILCDVFSGSCDPNELSKLLERPNTQVKTRNGFHGKVYLSDEHAVIGSANASRKGLEEDSALEAAVLLDDKEALSKAKRWFDSHWNHKDAREVDHEMLKEITPLWLFKKKRSTLLQALRQQPDVFVKSRIHFVIFWEPVNSAEHDAEYDALWQRIKGKNIYSPNELRAYGDDDHPFYIDRKGWKVKANDFVINYWVYGNAPKKAPELGGIWRVKSIRKIDNERVILGDRIRMPGKEFGFSFPRHEQSELGRLMQAHLHKQRFNRRECRAIEVKPDRLAGS